MLEARDTVMSEQKRNAIRDTWQGNPFKDNPQKLLELVILDTCQVQAEITWKAGQPEIEEAKKVGYEAHKAELCGNCDTPLLREVELYQKMDGARKEGMRKMVEWIKTYAQTELLIDENNKPIPFYCFDDIVLKAKLEELGL